MTAARRHVRSIDEVGRERIIKLLALTGHMHEINQRPVPKVPCPTRPCRVQLVPRGLHAHTTQF
jgi:hypothetical protein